MAMGADWCNAARGFMFALGCIQSLSCHTDRCPTGVATQDPKRWRKLDTADKSTRVFQFHENTVKALRPLLCAAGLEHQPQLGPEHNLRRVSQTELLSLAAFYRFLYHGELPQRIPHHEVFLPFFTVAPNYSFVSPDPVLYIRS